MPPRFAKRLTLLALLVACNSSDIAGPGDYAALAEAQARWNARPFADYSYEIRVVCFCPPEISRWTRVSVRGGAVVNAEAVEPDPNFPITNIHYWQPIDSIFSDIYQSMKDPSSKVYLDAIIARYDPVLGYPTNIEYRAKKNVADGSSTHSLRNVRRLD